MKVAILGSGMKLVQLAEPLLLAKGAEIVLVTGEPHKVDRDIRENERVTIVEGDKKDIETVNAALKLGVDKVWADLGGDDIKEMAQVLVKSMDANGVKRLLWTSTLSKYSKAPDEFAVWNDKDLGKILVDHAEAAKVVRESDLDYTIIQPVWVNEEDSVEYELSTSAAPSDETEVSVPSVATIVTDILTNDSHKGETLTITK
ncbi:NAD(P)H-binding protein [Bifidobacterium choloepi]|uniref:NAD(P)H-binding protein n=1 Tax=Bifidobacterium choloepi TaxID=2614131 RepID=A0A6I5NMX0_9BIFI|nr:NAD(P)H-binding protein [Bifidobacterium choloepi]NEG70072.1 NAD(P)H-binding protein [Bifidobacterium choloepi]